VEGLINCFRYLLAFPIGILTISDQTNEAQALLTYKLEDREKNINQRVLISERWVSNFSEGTNQRFESI
jgi:hypothetical protein